jgi:RHS repeat-associated protein
VPNSVPLPTAMSYSYNLAGLMVSESYPSGRVVTTSYDGAGRLSSVNGQKAVEANKTYAAGFSYWAQGAVKAVTLGNGLIEQTTYNARLQMTQMKLGTASSPASVVQLDYGYGTTNNNGNLLSQMITAPKTAGGSLALTQTYGYDSLNRLQSAGENGTAWQQTYDCDRFGNRAVRATSYIPSPQLTPQSASLTDFSAFDQSNNRLSVTKYPQVLYDFAGNLKRDQVGSTFTYDGENRQLTASVGGASASYFYDGDGQRVKKVVGSVTTVFVYNASGQLVAEYVSDPVPPPAGGGGTSYLTSDHLGSTRVVTKVDGSVKARYDYLPYGEELPSTIGGRSSVADYGSADSTKQKFTAKERDVESGLDYFLARYYSSAQGRFTSPDEFTGGPIELYCFAAQASSNPTFYADPASPQSLNKYQYAGNNPLCYVDPDGHDFLDAALELGGGIARGYAASVSLGTFPGSTPNEHDSAWSLAGQIIGTAYAFQQGANFMDGGAVAVPVTAPLGAAISVAGTIEVGGALLNFGRLTGTLLSKNANESGGNNSSEAGEHTDSNSRVEVRPGSSADNPQPTREVTPTNNSKAFDRVKGSPARRNKETGEIWVKDRLHKNHYEVYKNKKDFENGRRVRSVWDDGRLKETF